MFYACNSGIMAGMEPPIIEACKRLLAECTPDGACQADLFESGCIEAIETAVKNFSEWPRPISMSERPPDVGKRVLAYWEEHDRWLTLYWGGKKWDDNELESTELDSEEITHWLPIPPRPE